jgi:hypothetical protein
MKNIIIFIIVASLASIPINALPADPDFAHLSYLNGNVQVYTDDTKEWAPSTVNMPLLEGDRLWLPDGARTEVQFQGGLYVRLDELTAFDILALGENSDQFYVDSGHAFINNRQGAVDHIQTDTPLSSIGCYDNALAMIDVAESGATDISVLKGYCYAETRLGKTEIPAGSALHIGENLEAELMPIGPPDEWEEWNISRDRKIAEASESVRYLPDELDGYAYDFDTFGRWVYVAGYGYCWTPSVTTPGWAPYRTGKWVWINGNYIWISYEPWGWAPCHYGRWAFVAGTGWCWVPPRPGSAYWSPGYVGWVRTGDQVAWVPLAPGEKYYGYGNYGPSSVNITNITINRKMIRNEFRNIHVKNAVTFVNRKAFLTGGKYHENARENPFLQKDASFGPPTFKPVRETKMPVIRNIPRSEKPPARVEKQNVRELRRERTVVPSEKGSVFRPGRPAGQMNVIRRSQPSREPVRKKAAPRGPAEQGGFEKAPKPGQLPARQPSRTIPEEKQKPAAPVILPQNRETPRTVPGREKREFQRQPPIRAPEPRLLQPARQPVGTGQEERRKPAAPVAPGRRIEAPAPVVHPGEVQRRQQPRQPAPRGTELRRQETEKKPGGEIKRPSPVRIPSTPAHPPQGTVKPHKQEKPVKQIHQQNTPAAAPETPHRRPPATEKRPTESKPER